MPQVLSYIATKLRFVLSLLQYRLHHLISKLGSFGELGSEVLRNPLEAVPVGLEVSKRDAIRPCLEEISTSIRDPNYRGES
jgi:hypothetical protein